MTDTPSLNPNRPSARFVDIPEGENIAPTQLRVRASSVGQCPVALAASIIQPEPPIPATVLNSMNQGTRLEPAILDAARGQIEDYYGEAPVHSRRQSEMSMQVVDHPDFSVVVEGSMDEDMLFSRLVQIDKAEERQVVIDAKTISTTQWAEYADDDAKAKEVMLDKYQWQLASYMHGIGAESVVVALGVVDRDKYEGYGELTHVHCLFFEESELPSLPQYRAKVLEIAQACLMVKHLTPGESTWAEVGEALSPANCTPSNRLPFPCRMSHAHVYLNPAEELTVADVPEGVRDAIKTLNHLRPKAEETALTAKMDKVAKTAIKEWLKTLPANGAGERLLAGWRIKKTVGKAKESASITPDELRALGAAANMDVEHYITVANGRETVTVSYEGSGWDLEG